MSGYQNQSAGYHYPSADGGYAQASSSRHQPYPQENIPYDDGEAVYTSYYDDPEPTPESQTSPYDGDFDSPEANAHAYNGATHQPYDDRNHGQYNPHPQSRPASNAANAYSNAGYSQEPESLQFDSLRISDPIPRTASAQGYSRPPVNQYGDPIPRSASTAPPSGHRPPVHSHTTPPNFDHRVSSYSVASRVPSMQSTGSARTSGSGYENDVMNSYGGPAPGGGRPSMGPPNGHGFRGGPPPQSYPRQYPNQGGPPQQQFMPPPPQAPYNPLYDIASDVLGMGPPPLPAQNYASQSSLYPPNQGYQNPPQPQNYPPALNLNRENSALSGSSRASTHSDPNIPGPGPGMTRPTTKVIDINRPPYTKEYIDQYRARLKSDPDPETHFGYAKYLIDAAKKVGAGARDQRAVRKYRDSLIAESLKVIRRLATQGETYPDAQFFLANCYGTGMLGLEADHEKAYHMYLQASKNNHAQACYRVAVCNEMGAGTKRDSARAVAFYRKAATLGDTAAMYKLGMILLTGSLGQNKNPKDALIWLRRAAEQADEENPHALHELGLLYEQKDKNGLVLPDAAYAKELFTQAAQLGYPQSQFKLGKCYEYGELACTVDPKRSIAWYSKAAEKGDREAELAISGWYLTGSEGILVPNDAEAYLWARKAADKGLDKAEYAVGYYTEMGIGAKMDMEAARRWYMRAAAQGNPRAMQRLTELKRGDGPKGRRARPTRQQANDENCVVM